MRKMVLLCALTLVIGFILGIVCNFTFLFSNRPQLRTNVNASAASTPVPIMNSDPHSTVPPLDQEDNQRLLQSAELALSAMKAKDYAALGQLVHPQKGVMFTPYSTVSPERDLCIQASQLGALSQDPKRYIWGVTVGKGDPIALTFTAYFSRYVFNADFTQAPTIGIDTVLEMGNAQENVADIFPQARFVEYHFPGLDPKNEGFDWCSLKLVYEEYLNAWMLVGLIHSEWTP